MSKRGNFFEGLFTGIILGGILGVIFAPQSGRETRQKLRDLKDEQDPLFQNGKDKTDAMIAKTKDSIEKGFEKLSTMIENNKQVGKKNSDSVDSSPTIKIK